MATKKPAADEADLAVSDDDLNLAGDILAIFDAQDDEGNYLFEDEEVRHFLPMLLLASGAITPDMCTPEVAELLGELSVRAGVEKDDGPAERKAKIESYYKEFPPDPDMMAAVQRLLDEKGVKAGAGMLSAAVAKRMGQEASNKPVGQGGRVEGTVGGGVLGRLNAGKSLDKKKK